MSKSFVWIGLFAFGLSGGCGYMEVETIDLKQTGENSDGPEKPNVVPASETEEKTEPAKPLPLAPVPNKTIYAKSFINKPAPEFVVEQWLTKKPEMKGKMVLIDFWATWCGPCRKAIPELNTLHRKFGDRLVVVGVSDEPSEKVRSHTSPKMNYAVAVDPKRRMYDELEVQGIPHVILVDPTGVVRWEGFPFTAGHKLTEDVVDELLDTYVP